MVWQGNDLLPASYRNLSMNKNNNDSSNHHSNHTTTWPRERIVGRHAIADEATKVGDYRRAIQEYTAQINDVPGDKKAFVRRGKLYMKLQEFTKAVSDFTFVLTTTPLNENILILRAQSNEGGKKWKEAIDDYNVVLEDPSNYRTLAHMHVMLARGKCLVKAGQYKEALKDFHQHISRDSRSEKGYRSRAKVYTKMGHYELAYHDYQTLYAMQERGSGVTRKVLWSKARALRSFATMLQQRQWEATGVNALEEGIFVAPSVLNLQGRAWHEAVFVMNKEMHTRPWMTACISWPCWNPNCSCITTPPFTHVDPKEYIEGAMRDYALVADMDEHYVGKCWFLRGRCAAGMGHWEQSVEEYTRALECDELEETEAYMVRLERASVWTRTEMEGDRVRRELESLRSSVPYGGNLWRLAVFGLAAIDVTADRGSDAIEGLRQVIVSLSEVKKKSTTEDEKNELTPLVISPMATSVMHCIGTNKNTTPSDVVSSPWTCDNWLTEVENDITWLSRFKIHCMILQSRVAVRCNRTEDALTGYSQVFTEYEPNHVLAMKEYEIVKDMHEKNKADKVQEAYDWLIQTEEKESKQKSRKNKKKSKKKKKVISDEKEDMESEDRSSARDEACDTLQDAYDDEDDDEEESTGTEDIEEQDHRVDRTVPTAERTVRSHSKKKDEDIFTTSSQALLQQRLLERKVSEKRRRQQQFQTTQPKNSTTTTSSSSNSCNSTKTVKSAVDVSEGTLVTSTARTSGTVLMDERYLKKREKQKQVLRKDLIDATACRHYDHLCQTLGRVQRKHMTLDLEYEVEAAKEVVAILEAEVMEVEGSGSLIVRSCSLNVDSDDMITPQKTSLHVGETNVVLHSPPRVLEERAFLTQSLENSTVVNMSSIEANKLIDKIKTLRRQHKIELEEQKTEIALLRSQLSQEHRLALGKNSSTTTVSCEESNVTSDSVVSITITPPSSVHYTSIFNSLMESRIEAKDSLPICTRVDTLLKWLGPNEASEKQRSLILSTVQKTFMKVLGADLVATGSFPSKTYLPHGDLDATLILPTPPTEWYLQAVEALCRAATSRSISGLQTSGDCIVRNVTFVNAKVKVVQCNVNNVSVDVTLNQMGAVSAVLLLEEMDKKVGRGHLFKRSLLLIKGWCDLESATYVKHSILGARDGALSTYALNVIVMSMFNTHVSKVGHPIQALLLFLQVYSTFEWQYNAVGLFGPIKLSTMQRLESKKSSTSDEDTIDFVLSREFVKSISSVSLSSSSSSTAPTLMVTRDANDSTTTTLFPVGHCNVVDPLNSINNVARSVSAPCFRHLKTALLSGRNRLLDILSNGFKSQMHQPSCELWMKVDGIALDEFFTTSWSVYGKGDGFRNDLLVHPRQLWHGTPSSSSSSKPKDKATVDVLRCQNVPIFRFVETGKKRR